MQPTPLAESRSPIQCVTWRFVGCTIRGADHRKTGKTNQDAVRASASTDLIPIPEAHGHLQTSHGAQKGPLVVAVSDGHGSDAYTRSEIGSNRAVGAAISSVESFLSCCSGVPLNAIERLAQEQLPRMILDRWHQEIRVHQQSVAESEDNFKAYGCTLVCCAVTDEFTLAIQLGDGGLGLLDTSGQLHLPIPPDPRFVGGLTSSLCDTDALSEFQIKLIPAADLEVSLAIVCSDGLENCFSKGKLEQDFVANFQKFIRQNGIRKFADSLPSSLEDLSQKYSGDDITIGVFSRSAPDDLDFASEAAKLEWSESRSALLSLGIQNSEHRSEIRNALKVMEDRLQAIDLGDQSRKVDSISAQLEDISRKLDLAPAAPVAKPATDLQPIRSGFNLTSVFLIALTCLLIGGALGFALKPTSKETVNPGPDAQAKVELKDSGPVVATESDADKVKPADLSKFDGDWVLSSGDEPIAAATITMQELTISKQKFQLKTFSWFPELRGELRASGDLIQFVVADSKGVYTLIENKNEGTITLKSAKQGTVLGPFKRIGRS